MLKIKKLNSILPPHFQLTTTKGITSPCLLIKKDIINKNIQLFKHKVPHIQVYYAMKANSHPVICKLIKEAQFGFEVASVFEAKQLIDLNVSPNKILYGNPIRSINQIKEAHKIGIKWFTCDHEEDLINIHKIAPSSQIFLRLQHNTKGSAWPLSNKFGASEKEINALIKLAKKINLTINGISFHIGSQQTVKKQWENSIQNIITFSEKKRTQFDIPLKYINLGGGIPSAEQKSTLKEDDILDIIYSQTIHKKNSFNFIIEPGRSLIASAGCLISTILTTKNKDTKKWVYLDCGLFNGLMESLDGAIQLNLNYLQKNTDSFIHTQLAGPTCDSLDIIYEDILLPTSLQPGDPIIFMDAGAYTSSYSCANFNGFPPLNIQII